jgi:hypothetical protein
MMVCILMLGRLPRCSGKVGGPPGPSFPSHISDPGASIAPGGEVTEYLDASQAGAPFGETSKLYGVRKLAFAFPLEACFEPLW